MRSTTICFRDSGCAEESISNKICTCINHPIEMILHAKKAINESMKKNTDNIITIRHTKEMDNLIDNLHLYENIQRHVRHT